MALILAGIDEAGYGPLLGPLCVGLAVLRIEGWEKGSPAPDLWAALGDAVCRDVKGTRSGRIAIGDSKDLKLAKSRPDAEVVSTRHPLMHLERGVLALIAAQADLPIANDSALFAHMGGVLPSHPCYAGEAIRLPLCGTPDQQRLAGARLAKAMQAARVEPVDLRVRMVPEPEFNAIVRDRGTKAATTFLAISEHLQRVWHSKAVRSTADTVSVVCDRLGGRERYAASLAAALGVPLEQVHMIEESPTTSRYMVQQTAGGETRTMYVSFLVEGEQKFMPIAIASMIAKLSRELAMERFNRYWGVLASELGHAELKPTAGYTQDGRRWLKDAAGLVSAQDQRELVRIA